MIERMTERMSELMNEQTSESQRMPGSMFGRGLHETPFGVDPSPGDGGAGGRRLAAVCKGIGSQSARSEHSGRCRPEPDALGPRKKLAKSSGPIGKRRSSGRPRLCL